MSVFAECCYHEAVVWGTTHRNIGADKVLRDCLWRLGLLCARLLRLRTGLERICSTNSIKRLQGTIDECGPYPFLNF
jgi:hypothetical protein